MKHPLTDIIKAGLVALDLDGLCNPDQECGCGVDDLAPGIDCLNEAECCGAKFVQPTIDDSDYDIRWPEGYFKVV
jgi:hypothetical protein